MKLKDVKQLIDNYFDNTSSIDIINRFEGLGYVFEDIPVSNNCYQRLNTITWDIENQDDFTTVSPESCIDNDATFNSFNNNDLGQAA